MQFFYRYATGFHHWHWDIHDWSHAVYLPWKMTVDVRLYDRKYISSNTNIVLLGFGWCGLDILSILCMQFICQYFSRFLHWHWGIHDWSNAINLQWKITVYVRLVQYQNKRQQLAKWEYISWHLMWYAGFITIPALMNPMNWLWEGKMTHK